MKPHRIAWMILLAPLGCEPGEEPRSMEASAEARARGAALYAEHCTLCHGGKGDGRGVRSRDLARRPADFTNPIWRARQTPEGVFRAIRQGVPGTDMPAWHGLDDAQVSDLVAHVLSLGERR